MSQGSFLGLTLINIFIHDPFLFIETTTPWNYADFNTMYYLNKTLICGTLREWYQIEQRITYCD